MCESAPRELETALLVNSSRVYLAKINAEFAKQLPPGSLMLDVGAGNAPYKHLFAHVQYESVDFQKVDKEYAKSTYVADICERIPVEDGRFDFVLFNQVMEHLKEPDKALAELHRVLVPGGRLLCTVPLFYEEHETPYDFFRYTQFAHRIMFPAAGFHIEKIEWLEGFFGTCGYMLETMYRYTPVTVDGTSNDAWWARAFLAGFRPISLAAAGAFYKMDLIWKVTNVGFPKNYVIWAKKPLL
jgi:SAM-dependent methyltransferase